MLSYKILYSQKIMHDFVFGTFAIHVHVRILLHEKYFADISNTIVQIIDIKTAKY